MMFVLQLIVVLAFIYLGARLGSIGVGTAGGAGLLVLAILGIKVSMDQMPTDVITIIISVIVAISAMQVAGGLDYLVQIAERILRSNPKYLNVLAPVVSFFMTLMAGTGHTSYSLMPVITEIAKEKNIRPSRPLSLAVIASQIAITASPISAAVVALAAIYESKIDYLQILLVVIPTTLVALVLTAFIMMAIDKARHVDRLDTLDIYNERVKEGLVVPPRPAELREVTPDARRSLYIFLVGLAAVVFYATITSQRVGWIKEPTIGRNEAIIAAMLGVATLIFLFCNIKSNGLLNASVFRTGMSAMVCVLGVAWLGTTFMAHYQEDIERLAGDMLRDHSWTLALVLLVAGMLMYSQAATTRALMPTAFALGVSPVAAVASFAATAPPFMPTSPFLLAAIEIDDTGSTRIGRFLFNHPIALPGLINIIIVIVLRYMLGGIIL